ncbi:isopenicillin N synthase family oxygenase [Mycobacterium sp. 21AC1]|uniref:isopenicillin N synthase family dioxygenase n=1 Tax=[Mycobacterium] appelbergii TaxID=2939269 RepID=UPI0029390682|nr:2-oxoglutarate and iron-dependent oxygenase domain-containing protein [Mycobacterium sp. 21AC1]MDV3129771.1 isopenicillin N synthase family oxygenase [Mycobacterium sp. 21AC1]
MVRSIEHCSILDHRSRNGSHAMDGTLNTITVVDGFVPVIDLSARNIQTRRRALAHAIGGACETSGFFVIVGHGIPRELVKSMETTTNAFFRLPDRDKDRVATRPGVSGFRRFSGSTAQTLGNTAPPDLCEGFSTHTTGELGDAERAELGNYWASWKLANIWPAAPVGFKQVWQDYTAAMTELSRDLVRLFAMALDLEESFFDDKFDRHVSSLTANYYYPQHEPPLPGQMRRGAHTDFGALTVLYTEHDRSGLQVRTKDLQWVDVPAVRDSFVINIGDLMALWTGGRWKSTMHQVVNPQRECTSSRLSIPFFFQPNHDAVVEPMGPGTNVGDETSTVVAGEWISAKMQMLFTSAS